MTKLSEEFIDVFLLLGVPALVTMFIVLLATLIAQ